MSKIINPFPIFIYTNFVSKDNFITLEKDVLDFISNNQSLFIKSPSWVGETLTNIDSCKKKTINSSILNKIIKTEVEKYLKYLELNNFKNLNLSDLWINIAKPNHYQEEHHHANAFISGTLYLNVNKNSGNIQFINPLSSEFILMGILGGEGYAYNVVPQNGMILLFPSWLQHRVLPNKSTKDRISISFNITAAYE